MTEEQIKQNAEDYINENIHGVVIDVDVWNFLLDTYIAGAHSRDEEIKELKAYVEELRKQNAYDCNDYNAKILALKQKIDNLELKLLEL